MALVVTASSCSAGGDDAAFGDLPDIAFYAETNSVRVYDIFIASEGGDITQLTDDKLSYGPAWSPDGQQIAYVRGKPGSAEECCGYGSERIWVMDADGSNAEPLSTSDPTSTPQWTPDGAGLLFTVASGPDSGPPPWEDTSSLIRLNPQTGVEEVIFEGIKDYDFSMSPDGASFVRGGRQAILITDLASGAVTTEAQGVFKGGPSEVSWSPDGKWFAVVGTAEGTAARRFWAWHIDDDRLVPIEIGRGSFAGYAWTGPAELLFCYEKLVEIEDVDGHEESIYEAQLRRVKLGEDLVEESVTDFGATSNQSEERDDCLGYGMNSRIAQ